MENISLATLVVIEIYISYNLTCNWKHHKIIVTTSLAIERKKIVATSLATEKV
jgi:hypothetical protein